MGEPRCITPGAIWFAPNAGTGHVWRYDRRTSGFQAFSALDGLPIEDNVIRVTAASDERCAMLTHIHGLGPQEDKRVFLWEPARGWSALPAPKDAGVEDIAFDPGGRLVALLATPTSADRQIAEFKGGKWQRLCAVPQRPFSCLIPVPTGFVLGQRQVPSPSTSFKWGFVFTFTPANAGDDLTKSKTFEPSDFGGYLQPTYFFAGGKTFSVSAPRVLYELSSDRPRVLRDDPKRELYCGCDMKAADVLVYRVAEESDDCVTLRGEAQGVPEVKLSREDVSYFAPLRDPDGNYWLGSRRWDGTKWLDFRPSWQFPGYPTSAATQIDRARLDADGKTWSITDPQISLQATCYDPARHTAWVAPRPVWQDPGKNEMQLIRQGGAKREVLRTVPYAEADGLPTAQSADGDYWGRVRSSTGPGRQDILRITSSGLRRYPCELFEFRMARSPKGDLWALSSRGGEGLRYDPKADAFVKGHPLDDFAVTVGGKEFSHFPGPEATLYRKSEAGWEPFTSPFARFAAKVGDSAFHGDCILMYIGGVGVMEYNAKLDTWVRLIDSWASTGYDSRGRRIIASNCVLVYEGNSWANVPADNEDQGTFDRLLKQMDDDSYNVREDATHAMATAIDKLRNRMIAASSDPSLSAEVRKRLKSILSNTFVTSPPALFRTMHPVLTSAK
jgi:hypothetical protein